MSEIDALDRKLYKKCTYTRAISEVIQMSLFWHILCCLPVKLYTTGNVSLRAFEQNLFRWCLVHARVSAHANESYIKSVHIFCPPLVVLPYSNESRRCKRNGKPCRPWSDFSLICVCTVCSCLHVSVKILKIFIVSNSWGLMSHKKTPSFMYRNLIRM